jgi:hypothetical protein
MGLIDQAARFAAQAEPTVVVRRVLAPTGLTRAFREWLDTRTVSLPGGPDRIADLVAALDAAPQEEPLLLLLEFQSQHDQDKLETTLEEVAVLRCRVRYGDDRKGKYKVLPALVYLQGRCPEIVLDMTIPGGFGTRHAPLVWNVEEDNATDALEAVANGQASWGTLFWIPLVAGGERDEVIARWRAIVLQITPNRQVRGDLAAIALLFAELAKRRVPWVRGLEGFEMTELIELLDGRFPGMLTGEVSRIIVEQESLGLLDDWFKEAVRASSFEQFLTILKR